MNYTVRPAEKKDAEQISALLENILKLHAEGRPDIFRDCGAKYNVSQVAQMIDEDGKRLWVAADRDTVLGYVICKLTVYGDHSMCNRTCLWIDDLCIHPDHRRCGIGEALVRTAVEYARAENFTTVELNVWSFNEKAIAFYNRQGFKPQRTVMEFPLNGEEK